MAVSTVEVCEYRPREARSLGDDINVKHFQHFFAPPWTLCRSRTAAVRLCSLFGFHT